MKTKKLISIISPCYNEEGAIRELYEQVIASIDLFPEYEFEYIFIDNASSDGTVNVLRDIASRDKRVKIIINTRNFGHIRSPYWGIMQTCGDATIYLASDLQDPPSLIPEFLKFWQAGYKIVLGIKPASFENKIMHSFRVLYYNILDLISEVPVVKNATGFGLYDKVVIDCIRKINDPYPFLRGLICELGFDIKTVKFNQPPRLRGVTKNNFYTLFDIGMLGLISHSKALLRISTIIGFIVSALSVILGILYFVLKLYSWNIFPPGMAPLIISVFFLFGLLFAILGILGEYLAVIYLNVVKRPIVVEKERINFD